MGVAYLAHSNHDFVSLTRELIALEFDGDFNALITQISSEYTSRSYGDLDSELISASPEAINPNFLNSFFFTDDEGSTYSLKSQIYSPDAEYWSEEEFLTNHENSFQLLFGVRILSQKIYSKMNTMKVSFLMVRSLSSLWLILKCSNQTLFG